MAAARLGARCAFAGSLGDDELSRFVRQRLAEEGIALDYLRPSSDARPVHSVILVDETRHTRTIVYDANNAGTATPDWPPDDLLLQAKVLLVDYWGVAGMVRAAKLARAAGIPVVADLERAPPDDLLTELVELTDHLVVPLDFAEAWTNRTGAAEAARALWSDRRAAVVVTCGVDGSWYLGPEQACGGADQSRRRPDSMEKGKADRLPGGELGVRHQPAFRVATVDTTGCGDVFHGAYAAGLAEGLRLSQRVRLAAATAAIKATQPGGQPGIPSRAAVETFLQENAAEALG